jgi:hypothetical protein
MLQVMGDIAAIQLGDFARLGGCARYMREVRDG